MDATKFWVPSHLVVERPRPRRRQESTAGAREGDARAQQCRPHQNDETRATRPKDLKTTENNDVIMATLLRRAASRRVAAASSRLFSTSTPKPIALYDTTLRDGTQGEGVSLSLHDKLLISERLDDMGFDYIEGGYPLSNEKDVAFFEQVKYLGLKQGMEPMLRVYPPRPAKMWAEFEITKYIEYEKPGKYGDEQQKKYAFVPDDETPETQGLFAKLSEGDEVLLAWNHDYVTRTEAGGGQSKFPMRPVVMLEKR